MQRSYYTKAIVLNLKETGENNNSVTLITPDKGIIYATLYGGPKSKLRSLVAQWHSGKIWLYDNPEKKQTKISDMEVLNYHQSFGQNLFKMYAASLAAEIAIKTRCAGSPEQCFKLVLGFFDGMELCDEEQSRLGLIRFLWRYLALLGVQPEADSDEAFAPEAVSYYNGTSWNSVTASKDTNVDATNGYSITIPNVNTSDFKLRFDWSVSSSTGSNRDSKLDNVIVSGY